MDQQQTPPVPVPNQGITVDYAHAETNDFIHRVYSWMFFGLVVTGTIAYFVSTSATITNFIVGNVPVFFGLIILELACVIGLSWLAQKVNSTEAGILFIIYSALNGLTFSVIFLVYQMNSIASVFIITAGMFGIISLYGYITKRDLTTAGHMALMGLIGIILASVVNLFFYSNTSSLIIAYAGVLIFTVLTAYDTQKIKNLNAVVEIGTEIEKKEAIIGALVLYLDFVNLFLKLLRILGKRK